MDIAVSAPTRQDLIDVVGSVTNVYPPTLALRIVLPCCGRVREWPNADDIPDHDVGPCPCGNWFIRYGKADNENK